MPQYFVYIMSSHRRTLYTGVSSDLERRVYQHKHKMIPGFTSRYNVTSLVYYDIGFDVKAAIAREKQIKSWRREKRVALIRSMNPEWKDLSEGWYQGGDPSLALLARDDSGDSDARSDDSGDSDARSDDRG